MGERPSKRLFTGLKTSTDSPKYKEGQEQRFRVYTVYYMEAQNKTSLTTMSIAATQYIKKTTNENRLSKNVLEGFQLYRRQSSDYTLYK